MNQPMRELPQYKSHKIVHALKIHNIDLDSETGAAVITPAEDGYGPFGVDAEYMEKHKPRIGGYYVVYDDGYKSWSPADAFEKGYTKIGQQGESGFPFRSECMCPCHDSGNLMMHIVPCCQADPVDRDVALVGKIYWEDLAKQLATVWWEVSQVGGSLQHGDLDKPETMFSVALEQHGGRCFHGETPVDAWRKAHAWLVSPERPSLAWSAQCDTLLTKLQSVINSGQKRTYVEMKLLADRLTEMGAIVAGTELQEYESERDISGLSQEELHGPLH